MMEYVLFKFMSCHFILFIDTTHVKTHKLLQVCKQVVTNLFTSCRQVVFALLVPQLLQQVWKQKCFKVDDARL